MPLAVAAALSILVGVTFSRVYGPEYSIFVDHESTASSSVTSVAG